MTRPKVTDGQRWRRKACGGVTGEEWQVDDVTGMEGGEGKARRE